MTLVNTRAAFEKAVTDAVAAADNTVKMVYDNVHFTTPGKNTKYILMTIDFTQSTLQNQGAASDYYAGVIQCNVYVPKSKGTSVLSAISEAVTAFAAIFVSVTAFAPKVFSCTKTLPINGILCLLQIR